MRAALKNVGWGIAILLFVFSLVVILPFMLAAAICGALIAYALRQFAAEPICVLRGNDRLPPADRLRAAKPADLTASAGSSR